MLVWNYPDTSSPFVAGYQSLTQEFGHEHRALESTHVDDGTLRGFFASGDFEKRAFENRQVFDFGGLKGRLLSSSRMLGEREEGFEEMIRRLRRIFDEHESGGTVILDYETTVFYGRL